MPPNVNDNASHVRQHIGGSVKKTKQQAQERNPVIPRRKETAPFTIGDLKRAIPAHCFKPTYVESFSHLALDLVQVAACIAAIMWVDTHVQNPVLWTLAWIAYWVYQGVTLTGVWVIAHECGHGGFSKNQLVNDIVGFCLHTALYVPYFAWQKTHASHHHYTNNLARDEVFVPKKHDGVTPLPTKNPIQIVFGLLVMLVFGWPMYLINNTSGHSAPGFNSHFWPYSSIFNDNDRFKVQLSNLGLVAWSVILVVLGNAIGSSLLLRLYLPPLLIVNGFLVAITYLQHTDQRLPHYDEDEWTWLRGALCTVDRTMGRFLDVKLHFIHSTHICHHIFHELPFYRAEEATRALIPVLGKYYQKDDSNFALTLYRNFRDCNFLEDERGIVYWLDQHLG